MPEHAQSDIDLRRAAKQIDCEMMRGLSIQREQQRPNESFVASVDGLHFSLTPGFSRVPAQPQVRSRLNGFRSQDRVITGLKSGVNEIRVPHRIIWSV